MQFVIKQVQVTKMGGFEDTEVTFNHDASTWDTKAAARKFSSEHEAHEYASREGIVLGKSSGGRGVTLTRTVVEV